MPFCFLFRTSETFQGIPSPGNECKIVSGNFKPWKWMQNSKVHGKTFWIHSYFEPAKLHTQMSRLGNNHRESWFKHTPQRTFKQSHSELKQQLLKAKVRLFTQSSWLAGLLTSTPSAQHTRYKTVVQNFHILITASALIFKGEHAQLHWFHWHAENVLTLRTSSSNAFSRYLYLRISL